MSTFEGLGPEFARQYGEELARITREVAAEIEAEVEAEAARAQAELLAEFEAAKVEPAEPEEPPTLRRSDYVPKEYEARYVGRDENGLPALRLVDAGDRLAVWSPLDGGALLNPKGPGLRSLGLVTSYARGSAFHASAFRSADLRKGRPVELRAEPDNPHDRNAVAMYAPRARKPFGYVGRGRAVSVSRRLLAGEDLVGVTLWGPGPRRDDRSALVLIGPRVDLDAMLNG